jgi:putative ABC transport system permease protein
MRLYRILLHCYPRSFRAEYGAELCAVFARRRRGASGPGARVLLWIEAAADIARNAAALHADLLVQDLRCTLRSLARARGFTITAIVVAALGVGATTAAFSIADHVLLRPLPFAESHRLVQLWQDQSFRGYPRMEQSPSNFLDWQRLATSFDGMAAYTSHSANLVGQGDPARLEGTLITPGAFAVLRARAALGRILASVDAQETSERTVVLSQSLWQAKFGSDRSVLGRTITLNDTPHIVVGVMPAGFEFPRRDVDYWIPLRFSPEALGDRADTYLDVVARLKDGVSLEQARSEMRVVAAQLERAYPKENAQTGAAVYPLRDQVGRQARMLLFGLLGAAVCMLLIGCANLSNLLLARALGRRTELAIRAAVGAGRERLMRQTLTESVVLAGAGGALGVLLAVSVMPLLARLVPTTLPIPETPGVDLRMLGAAAVVTLATGVATGVLPAIRTSRGGDADALREGARTGTSGSTERVRATLVTAAIAASVVLLIASGLLARALWRVQQIDPGFRPDNVLTLRTALPMTKYGDTARRQQFYDRVLGEVRTLPGVTSAAYVSSLPMVMRGGIWPVVLDWKRLSESARSSWAPDASETRMASFRLATPGFFAAMNIPVLRGRDISDQDGAGSPWVAVVSQSFADQMWPGQDPLGREFFIAFHERTVVGVVGNVRVRGLERESEPQVYVPSRQVGDNALAGYVPKDLVVSGTVPTTGLVPAIRQILARVDPEQPISDVRMLTDIVSADTAARQVQIRVLVGFAAISFLLAGVGLHGLLAFAVSSRTREIGLRMALGARSSELISMVVGRGLTLAATGIAVGAALGVAIARTLQAILAGVSPMDPAVYASAIALALLMTLLGCLLPAMRAVRVDPILAIRSD